MCEIIMWYSITSVDMKTAGRVVLTGRSCFQVPVKCNFTVCGTSEDHEREKLAHLKHYFNKGEEEATDKIILYRDDLLNSNRCVHMFLTCILIPGLIGTCLSSLIQS